MGLDISLYSVKSEPKDDYEAYVVNDEVELFEKHFGKNAVKTKTNEYYDFGAIGITDDCFDLLSEDWDDECVWKFQNVVDKRIVTVKDSEIPLREQDDKVVYIQQIGYQRGGLNGLFYDKYTDDDFYVFTKERLQFIYENFVEEGERKEHFKRIILDKFEEGKTFVTFWW